MQKQQPTYQVVIQGVGDTWHKSHAVPFKTLAAAQREQNRRKHQNAKIVEIHPTTVKEAP